MVMVMVQVIRISNWVGYLIQPPLVQMPSPMSHRSGKMLMAMASVMSRQGWKVIDVETHPVQVEVTDLVAQIRMGMVGLTKVIDSHMMRANGRMQIAMASVITPMAIRLTGVRTR
jgi:hypothetical protein